MNLKLDGKVAIVTGGSRGIGKSISTMLSSEGVKVVITGRDESALDITSREITQFGGEVLSVIGDVMNPASSVDVV